MTSWRWRNGQWDDQSLREFDSELAGVAVFADNAQEEREKQFDYKSLLKVTNIDVKNQAIDVEVGNIFDEDK